MEIMVGFETAPGRSALTEENSKSVQEEAYLSIECSVRSIASPVIEVLGAFLGVTSSCRPIRILTLKFAGRY
jgi:hypothetical protein